MPFTLSNPQVNHMIDSLKRESPTPRATPPSLQPSTLLKKIVGKKSLFQRLHNSLVPQVEKYLMSSRN